MCELDASSSGQRQVTGSCENGIDVFGAKMVVRINTVRYLRVKSEERLDGTRWVGSVVSRAGLDTFGEKKD